MTDWVWTVSKVTVVDQEAWDEEVPTTAEVVKESVFGTTFDSVADWEEWRDGWLKTNHPDKVSETTYEFVTVDDVYLTMDGHRFLTDYSLQKYSESLGRDSNFSYKVVPYTKTVHHDAVTHEEERGEWKEQVVGQRCGVCGEDKAHADEAGAAREARAQARGSLSDAEAAEKARAADEEKAQGAYDANRAKVADGEAKKQAYIDADGAVNDARQRDDAARSALDAAKAAYDADPSAANKAAYDAAAAKASETGKALADAEEAVKAPKAAWEQAQPAYDAAVAAAGQLKGELDVAKASHERATAALEGAQAEARDAEAAFSALMPEKPEPRTVAWDGYEQQGVSGGPGYTVSGDASASAVGKHAALAVPAAGYEWSDGTTGAVAVTWEVVPAQAADASFAASPWVYDGVHLTPKVAVSGMMGQTVLEEGSDFDVVKVDADVSAGVGAVTVRGKGNLTGETRVPLKVLPAAGLSFDDVATGDWFAESAWWARANGVVEGYAGTNSFAPYDGLTRAQAAAVLMRRLDPEYAASHDGPQQNSSRLSDVEDGQWYTAAVNWAVSRGIMSGYAGTGTFGPDDVLTREQLCAVVANAAAFSGQDTSAGEGALEAFPDGAQVSDWARPAFAWAVEKGVVSGVAGEGGQRYAQPQAPITRAQMAAVAMNAAAAGVL